MSMAEGNEKENTPQMFNTHSPHLVTSTAAAKMSNPVTAIPHSGAGDPGLGTGAATQGAETRSTALEIY